MSSEGQHQGLNIQNTEVDSYSKLFSYKQFFYNGNGLGCLA